MQTKNKLDIFIKVNGDPFDIKEALRSSLADDEHEFLDSCIEEMLIRQYASQNGISNTDRELLVAAEELRYQAGMESVEKFRQHMDSNHQTLLSMQNNVDYVLLRHKVRGSIPDREIAAYFTEHQLEFDRVDLYSIRLNDEDKANELYASIIEDSANFHLLAMQHSVDEETKLAAGYVGKMSRKDLTGEIEAKVFSAQAGEVFGPLLTEKGYNLFKVAEVYPANLSEERENIRLLLFMNLLAKLRAEATISYPILEEEQ